MERMSISDALERLETVDGATATYCPEDNKLRLYCGRVPRDDYVALRSLGFQSTPKQDCDFVAVWTPYREDAALALIEPGDDIGDEDQSPEDRAADRAERFAGYRDKRRGEAIGHADAFEGGPSVFGHQDARKAERAAARHDRQRVRAVSQWSKAEYWQTRTRGVIGNALHRSDATTRRGRILRLEAEQRKRDAAVTPCPNTKPIMQTPSGGGEPVPHVWIRNGSRGGHWFAQSAVEKAQNNPDRKRWTEHYAMRLEYERQMLEAEGGTAGDADMVPGGFFGGMLIVKVNKSNATGAVVSVNVHKPKRPEGERWDYRRRGDTLLLNVQRSGEKAYSPPTPESLAQLAEIKGAAKAKAKAAPAKPKLINPTDEDAERLQAVWNERAKEPGEVLRITQAEYSARSKGTYARYETVGIAPNGHEPRRRYGRQIGPGAVLKVRRGPSPYQTAPRVVVLTDKPRKPIPWDTMQAAQAERPTPESLAPQIGEIAAAVAEYTGSVGRTSDERQTLLNQAEEAGLLQINSASQIPWTERGAEILKAHREAEKAEGVTQ